MMKSLNVILLIVLAATLTGCGNGKPSDVPVTSPDVTRAEENAAPFPPSEGDMKPADAPATVRDVPSAGETAPAEEKNSEFTIPVGEEPFAARSVESGDSSATNCEDGKPADVSVTMPDIPQSGETAPVNEKESTLIIRVGEQTFTAQLADNDAAAALMERLPLTIQMSELNGNEKYHYLDESLPTDAETPGKIHTGDLMLYGDDCLVLFYESFSSGYRYTQLGSIADAAGLAEALGTGVVTVTLEAES